MTYPYNLALPGPGTVLGYATTSGGTPTNVAQVKTIDGPSLELGTWDSTTLESTWAEVLPTLPKGGEITFNVVYNPADATHAALLAALAAKTLYYWTIAFMAPVGPGASGAAKTASFAAYVTGFADSGIEEEGFVMAAIKLSITGPVAVA